MPHAAWQSGGDLAVDILLTAYDAVLSGADPPARMRLAFSAMLPKGVVLPSDGNLCRRSPSAMRPITPTNTWDHFVMAAINRPVAESAAREVVGIQRGIIRGRSRACNIYEPSAAADAWAT